MPPAANASTPPALTPASALEFHDLVVHRVPGREPLLGCPAVRRFLEVDEDTLLAVDAMKAHRTLGEAAAALEAQTGEEWDLVELAERLRARGFVRKLDGAPLKVERPVQARHRLLYALPAERLRWLHHPATLALLGALVVAWLGTLVAQPSLAPRTLDLFLFGRPALVFVSTTLGFLLFGYAHELAHFFVARSHGVDPKIKVGHRLYVVTLETDVTNAWTLSTPRQIHIFLAGILLNLTLASSLGLVAAAMQWGLVPHPEWVPALRFAIMLNVFPLALQLFFFTRTDLYFVVMAATGERNLLGDARGYLRLRAKRLWRLLRGHPADACAECGRKVFEDEPFCVRCGALHDVRDPNKHPYSAASRKRLLAFGLFFLAGQLAGLVFVLAIGLRFQVLQVLRAWSYAARGVAARDWAGVGEGALAFALALVQVSFVLYFLGVSVGGRAWKRWTARSPPVPTPAIVAAPPRATASPAKRAARKRRKNKSRRRAR